MLRPTQLERTAFHEAGHAVAAYFQRRRILRVSIVPDPEDRTLGHCSYGQLWKDFNPEINDDNTTTQRLETLIITALAGLAAETKLSGRHNWKGAHSDTGWAHDLAFYVAGYGKEAHYHYFRWMLERTRGLFEVPFRWALVEALASELLSRREIGGRQARKIIHDAMLRQVPEQAVGSSPFL